MHPQTGESPEMGVNRLTLMASSQDFYTSLPEGTHTLTVYVFIEIPEPFLDQEYLGTLALEAYS